MKWINIKDELPAESDSVLLANSSGILQGFRIDNDYIVFNSTKMQGVTHWMPLPEPPKHNKDA